MKTVFTNLTKTENYKPIYKSSNNWYVCFNKSIILKESNKTLKNGRYVNEHKSEPTDMCQYSYIVYKTKPSINTIKTDLADIINNEVSRKIINEFVWNGNHISLTKENQMNYKASYDLAIQTGGINLPLKIKTTKNGHSEYLVFSNINEFSDFYVKMNKYINDCLSFGWERKDNIDYSVYDI